MPLSKALESLEPLGQVIRRYGLRTQKSLGQNFLLDLNITRKILRFCGSLEGKTVIEVGPGPGGLTRVILEQNPKECIAIERDQRCIEALKDLKEIASERLTLIQGDALDINLSRLGTSPRHIIANLPYNIATLLLIQWLKNAQSFERMTLMFQKEVAERILASPGSPHYGRLSVLVNWLTQSKRLFDLSPQAFTPPPKVMSTVVQLIPRPTPLYPCELKSLELVTKHAFGQRRKMLRASLKTLFPDYEKTFADAGVLATQRAEELTIEQFCALAHRLDTRPEV